MSVTQAPAGRVPAEPPSLRQRLLGTSIIWAIVLGAVGYFIGHLLGTKIGNHIDAQAGTDQDDIAILIGLVGATLGWLGGLGFYSYPLARMLGRRPSLHEHDQGVGAWRYFRLCTDHKVVALQYFVAVLFFFFVGGLNAMLIRAELTSPNAHFINAGNYLTLVSLHGKIGRAHV